MIVNRREFLRRSIYSALGGAALYSQLGNLKLVSAATRAAQGTGFSDYKALVCVFLFGGNDSFNTVVPYSLNDYNIYQASRPAMAHSRASLQPMQLTPQAGGLPSDGATYALHPAMPELRDLFNAQHASIVANVGTLLGPITQLQYQSNPTLAPPQLFSHADQSAFWQTSRPDDASANGWGGRIADLLYAGNADTEIPMTMSLAGQSLFQRGSVVNQYVMQACSGEDYCGINGIGYLDDYQNELGAQTFNALMADGVQAHMFERAYGEATRRAIGLYTRLGNELSTLPVWNTPFPTSSLGGQLRQVANLINARSSINLQRQIFFVAAGGYDTHDSQLATQAAILADLSASLNAFHQATVQMGISNEVTTFTASDFGRTVSTNGDGTDHGWGGHHFVLGGAVNGGRFYGQMPSLLQNGNPDDAGYGQIIPTTGVDQYAATLASWFGVAPADIPLLFPAIGEYASSDLGFMI